MIRVAGRFSALATLTVAVVTLIGCGSALAATPQVPAAPSYLFSIPTSSGSLTGPGDHHLTLRLTGTRTYLTRFTGRPLRQAFLVANTDFARRFKTYFATSDPNAVLTYTPAGTQIPVSIVLTVGRPRWSAAHHSWTFSATRIRKQPNNLPGTVHIKPPVIANPRTFTQATLLIDASSPSAGTPSSLTGVGIAASLTGFLQRFVAATFPGAAGQNLSMSLAVTYSYALTYPYGGGESTAVVPVEFSGPGPLYTSLCRIEHGISDWQDANEPSLMDGAYIFDLTFYSSGQPVKTETLRYAIATGSIESPACSG